MVEARISCAISACFNYFKEVDVDLQLLAALIVGVAAIILIILKTRLDAFPALLIGAIVTGLVAGVAPVELVGLMTAGFGNTLASIGIVIGLGVALGKLMEVTGAADALARAFVKLFGKGREALAMTMTGSVVSIPVFCDSGYVMLHPLARSLARRTQQGVVVLSLALAGGLVLSHTLVPPTPGPLAVAGLLGVDLGVMFLVGIPFIIVLIPVVLLFARIMGNKLEPFRDPSMFALEDEEANTRPVIGAFRAALPIVVPILLIVSNTASKALFPGTSLEAVTSFIGAPAIALLIGLVLGAYTLPQRGTERKEVVGWLSEAAASGGLIIFITGAGGAFANVLTESGVGSNLADGVGMLPLPLFLIPFLVASVLRVAQGSGTVAMITAATLAVPLVEAGTLNPVLAAMAAACGAFLFSHFNDSFFWVVTKFAGLSGTKAMKAWSGMTTTIWVATIPLLFILWAIVG